MGPMAALLVSGILSATTGAARPEGVFRHLSIDQGLSDSHLRSIVQDRDGFLWFGTVGGLNRYDGYEVRIFEHEPGNPRSLGSSFVYVLYVDRSGMLWVGTLGGGLHRYDPWREDFVRYRHDPNDPETLGGDEIYSLWDDGEGSLWVGTSSGLDRLIPSSGRVRRYRHDPTDAESLGDGGVYAILQDRAGALWLGTASGLDRMLSDEPPRFQHYRHDPADPSSLAHDFVNVLVEDAERGLWVGTWGGGLDRLDPARGTFQHHRDRGFESPRVWTIRRDARDRLWVGGVDSGLALYDRERDGFTAYRHDPGDPKSLTNDVVISIYADREGLLWVGTGGGGVNLLDPERKPFATVPLDGHRAGGPSRDVRAVHRDGEGTLWVGTFGDGLYAYDESSGSVRRYRHDPGKPTTLRDDVVLSIAEASDGGLWVGTSSALHRMDRSTGRFRAYRHDPSDARTLSDPSVLALLDAPEREALWVGTSVGLDRLDVGSGKIRRIPDPDRDNGMIFAIRRGRGGELWLARMLGLDRFDPETGRFQHHRISGEAGANESAVWSIHETDDGRLWLGTTIGLLSLDSETGTLLRHEDPSEPLGALPAILEDAEGRLWLGRTRGLSRFDPTTGRFRHFSAEETGRRQSYAYGALEDSDGRLYFGAGDGLTVFLPSAIEDSRYAPPVVLTGFELAARPVAIGEGSLLVESLSRSPAIAIPSRERVFAIRFAALSFRAPERNRYRYRLEGFDESWTEVNGELRRATYTNIPPGSYRFRVQGSNNDGFWNEEGTALRLEILPAWWQSSWFRWGAVAAAAAGLFGVHRLRLEKLREREERNRSVLESLKSYIALLDREGRITVANDGWASFPEGARHGIRAAVGDPYLKLLSRRATEGDETARKASRGLGAVLVGEQSSFDLEYSWSSPSGVCWYSMTAVPFRGREGGAVVSYTDVTERKRSEEEAKKHREELAHVSRVATLGELTTSIAHEINQPLSSIVTYANAGRRFLSGGSSEELPGILKAIAEQGKRAGDVVRHLRTLLRKGEPERARLDVNEMVRAVLALAHGDALARGIEMESSLGAGLPAIAGNPIELQQVMLNLVMNAFEAMETAEEGSREVKVSTWTDDGSEVQVAFRDSGPPVADEVFERMFQRLYTSKRSGLGIGLSISRSIVESHGGALWAVRNGERGITMRLRLPGVDGAATESRLL